MVERIKNAGSKVITLTGIDCSTKLQVLVTQNWYPRPRSGLQSIRWEANSNIETDEFIIPFRTKQFNKIKFRISFHFRTNGESVTRDSSLFRQQNLLQLVWIRYSNRSQKNYARSILIQHLLPISSHYCKLVIDVNACLFE